MKHKFEIGQLVRWIGYPQTSKEIKKRCEKECGLIIGKVERYNGCVYYKVWWLNLYSNVAALYGSNKCVIAGEVLKLVENYNES